MYSLFHRTGSGKTPSFTVLPVIKNRRCFAGAAEQPLCEPLAGDLLLTYVMDGPGKRTSIDHASLDMHGLHARELRRLATANAVRALGRLRTRTTGAMHELTAEHGSIASSYLFAEFWQQIEKQLGGVIVAAFPHPDAVFYARLDTPDITATLKAASDRFTASKPEKLSEFLYRFHDSQWHEVVT